MPLIRHALAHDAPQLSALAERTFRATFGAQNTAENMELHCRLTYSDAIQAREITAANRITFLSEDGGALTGFAQLRWDAAPTCVLASSPGEIQRFYVVAEHHGRGIAHALMNSCLEELRGRGSDVVWLGVWEHNPRAITFYRKFGFVEVGAHVFPLGDDPQRDIIMARPVGGLA